MPRRSASSSVSRCTSVLGQRAQNLLGQFLADGDQQDRRLAHPGHGCPSMTRALRRSRFPVRPRPRSFASPAHSSLPLSPASHCAPSNTARRSSSQLPPRSIGVNPALQQARALRRLALQMSRSPVRRLWLRFRCALEHPACSAAVDASCRIQQSRPPLRRSHAASAARGLACAASAGRTPKASTTSIPTSRAAYLTSTASSLAVHQQLSGHGDRRLPAVLVEGQILDRQQSPRAASKPTAAWASAVRLRNSSAERGCHTAACRPCPRGCASRSFTTMAAVNRRTSPGFPVQVPHRLRGSVGPDSVLVELCGASLLLRIDRQGLRVGRIRGRARNPGGDRLPAPPVCSVRCIESVTGLVRIVGLLGLLGGRGS